MKRVICLLLSMNTLFLTAITASANVNCDQVHYPMYFNGNAVSTNGQPILSLNDRTYVPLRMVGEGTGLEVFWEAKNEEIFVRNIAYIAAKDHMLLSQIYNDLNNVTLVAYSSYLHIIDYIQSSQKENLEFCISQMEVFIESATSLESKLIGFESDNVTKEMYTSLNGLIYNANQIVLGLKIAKETMEGYYKGYYDSEYSYETLDLVRGKMKELLTEQCGQYKLMDSIVLATKITLDDTDITKYKLFDYQTLKNQ